MNKIKVYNNPYIKEHASEIDFFKSHFIDAFANNDTTQEHRAFQPCENIKIFNDKLENARKNNLLAGYIPDKIGVTFCDSFSCNPLTPELLEKNQYILIINDVKIYHSLKRSILEGAYNEYFEFCE